MKNHMKSSRRGQAAGVVLLSLFLSAGQASAALIAHEPFDYDRHQWYDGTNEGDGIDGLNGGTGWASPWVSGGSLNSGIPADPEDYEGAGARTSPLSYTDGLNNSLVTSGNQVRTAFGSNSWDRRTLDEPIGADGSTVWLSFLGQAHGNAGSSRWAFVELSDNASSRVWVGNVNPVASGNWGIFLPDRGEDAGGAVSDDAGDDFKMADQTMFLVKLEFPDNPAEELTAISVWLNPSSLADESALDAPVFLLETDQYTFNQVGVAGRYSTDFDEIRLGTTFDSVTPVPEPGTYAVLLSLGVLGLVLLRRRFTR